MNKRHWLLVVLLTLLFSIPLSIGFAWLMSLPSNRIVHQWHQPKEIEYRSFDPYTLSVIEGNIRWNHLDFSRRYSLFIGRGTDAPAYGCYIDFSFYGRNDEIDDEVKQSTVEWTPEGLTFIAPSGIRLFVPKDNFIGGR